MKTTKSKSDKLSIALGLLEGYVVGWKIIGGILLLSWVIKLIFSTILP